MSEILKKAEFVRKWYNSECAELCFSDKLKLARMWSEICVNDEEYEIVIVLQEERRKMIKKHAKDKIKKRSLVKRAWFWFYLMRKKIRRKK